jgi:hypothetical protein
MVDFVKLAETRVVVNIGQIDKPTKSALEREVRAGRLAKWRGYWFPVAGADYGIGPLKTCYGPTSVITTGIIPMPIEYL